jgi:AraC-like DNA-binding protein
MEKKSVEDYFFGLNANIAIYPPWDSLHRHDEIEMSFFRAKKPAVFRIGGKVVELEPDSTLLFWGTIPHQIITVDHEAMQYYITIPPYVFLSWNLPDNLTQGILNGSIFIENDKSLRRMDIASFPVWIKEADTTNPQLRIAFNRSLEARIRRFGGVSQPALSSFDNTPHSVKDNKAFLRILEYLTQNYKNDIKIKDIAKAAGIHPNYTISLFRKESGVNITHYILMLRTYESQRLLLTTDMKIIDIAMETGFDSMSNFYKYFKKICGKTPRDYRKSVVA